MTASTLALDMSLPRSDNRFDDAFLPTKRRRGSSCGDVLEAITRSDGMSSYDEIVSDVNSEDVWETCSSWRPTLSGDEHVTAGAPVEDGCIDNTNDYAAFP